MLVCCCPESAAAVHAEGSDRACVRGLPAADNAAIIVGGKDGQFRGWRSPGSV